MLHVRNTYHQDRLIKTHLHTDPAVVSPDKHTDVEATLDTISIFNQSASCHVGMRVHFLEMCQDIKKHTPFYKVTKHFFFYLYNYCHSHRGFSNCIVVFGIFMCMRVGHQSELSQKTTDSEHWSIGASPVHADQDRSNVFCLYFSLHLIIKASSETVKCGVCS